ncbi:MAG TPA: hypothetical protein VMU74_05435 [Gaiellaceae bacterium]|nr:hypothetical protein [Gaiellaceae bacterium]
MLPSVETNSANAGPQIAAEVVVTTNGMLPEAGAALCDSDPHRISFGGPTTHVSDASFPVVPPTRVIPEGATR